MPHLGLKFERLLFSAGPVLEVGPMHIGLSCLASTNSHEVMQLSHCLPHLDDVKYLDLYMYLRVWFIC